MRNNVLVIRCSGIWNHNRRGGEQKERLGANVRDMSRLSGILKATVFCWLKEAWSVKVKEPRELLQVSVSCGTNQDSKEKNVDGKTGL